jgi:hypothetical protein
VVFTAIEGLEAKYPPADDIRPIGHWVDCLDRI